MRRVIYLFKATRNLNLFFCRWRRDEGLWFDEICFAFYEGVFCSGTCADEEEVEEAEDSIFPPIELAVFTVASLATLVTVSVIIYNAQKLEKVEEALR